MPHVAIIYCHVGMTEKTVRALIQDVSGIILVGLGHGKNPNYIESVLKEAASTGVKIVRTSRVLGGIVSEGGGQGFICGDSLMPQQAKILLQLSLDKGETEEEIQHNFRIY